MTLDELKKLESAYYNSNAPRNDVEKWMGDVSPTLSPLSGVLKDAEYVKKAKDLLLSVAYRSKFRMNSQCDHKGLEDYNRGCDNPY